MKKEEEGEEKKVEGDEEKKVEGEKDNETGMEVADVKPVRSVLQFTSTGRQRYGDTRSMKIYPLDMPVLVEYQEYENISNTIFIVNSIHVKMTDTLEAALEGQKRLAKQRKWPQIWFQFTTTGEPIEQESPLK